MLARLLKVGYVESQYQLAWDAIGERSATVQLHVLRRRVSSAGARDGIKKVRARLRIGRLALMAPYYATAKSLSRCLCGYNTLIRHCADRFIIAPNVDPRVDLVLFRAIFFPSRIL